MHKISITNNLSSTLDNLIGIFSFILLILSMTAWFRDIHLEAITGNHTEKVQEGLRSGMILFIVSEVMFFFAFFWAFFPL
jgi:heme/copper-type cytochrome/quinol oxidase subunit 3